MGTLKKYIEQTKYKDKFDSVEIASNDFDRIWEKIAKEEKDSFKKDQHLFIKKTHYDIQIRKLKNNNITFINKNSAAIHDMIWSTSVQYGPSTSLIIKAFDGKNIQNLSNKEIIATVQDYKFNTVHIYFKSSPTWHSGLKSRASSEKNDLLKLENKGVTYEP